MRASDLTAAGAPDDGSTPPVQLTGPVSGSFIGEARDNSRVIINNVKRDPVSLPHRVGAAPALAAGRQDRDQDRQLFDALTGGGTAVVAGQVVTGMGGVGKTQVAAALAHRLWGEDLLDLLVWAPASSPQAVQQAYAVAAADVTGVEDDTVEAGAARFVNWLAAKAQADLRWLVVLDDLQSPADLTGLWPPHTPAGRCVVTTRRRDPVLTGPATGRVLVEVGVFTPREAHAYLRRVLGDDPVVLDEAAGLTEDLGNLALALAQAAGFIGRSPTMTCAAYRRKLTDQRRALAKLLPPTDALPDGYNATVAATFAISIDAANALEPQNFALPLLQAAALLSPDGIPTAFFRTDPMIDYLATITGAPAPESPEQRADWRDDIDNALQLLHGFSLLTIDANLVRVHGLVQRAVREDTPAHTRAELAWAVGDALVAAWPPIANNPQVEQTYRTNTTALNTTSDNHLWHNRGHPVLFQVGYSLGAVGQVTAAAEHFQQLHTTATERLGADHADPLTTRHNLAYWRGAAGDPDGAAAAMEQLLADRVRVLGADHADTLTTRHDLAHWRGEAGDHGGAVAAMEQLLADQVRVLGADHPDTLTTRHSLARCRGAAGDPDGAAAAMEQLLADRVRVLGADHADTLTIRHNLAYCRGEAGDPDGAAAAMEQLLADQVRVLGADHPHTL
ncbi:tetratricopeptide repeat protein, partial [Pilimelia columellifera]|uniref:tetratricopeptide repeat protein n=1 Tax=Pilimelia columellifera TaxID=706574 RepID=UPI0031E3C40D